MSDPTRKRDVFSIVCACVDGPAAAVAANLGRRVQAALATSGAAAARVLELEHGIAAIFLNTTAALEFARTLIGMGDASLPLRLGVHFAQLDANDAQLAQRPALRAAQTLALRARFGQLLASSLFRNFVTNFDHRCKTMLRPATEVAAAPGGAVFEVRFDVPDAAPRAGTVTAAPTPAGSEAYGFLPRDAATRQAFLDRAEHLLAQEIGPLARLIVKQAESGARTRAAFQQRLADAIPDAERRAALLRALAALVVD